MCPTPAGVGGRGQGRAGVPGGRPSRGGASVFGKASAPSSGFTEVSPAGWRESEVYTGRGLDASIPESRRNRAQGRWHE